MTAGGTVWSAREFLGKLARTTEKERRRIRSVEDLETVARGLATRDVLLARARAGGMERDSDVVNQVRRVRDEYFLKRWASAVQDTVGLSGWKEGELRSYFQEHRENYALPPEVNVAEVLVRTEGEARDVMRRLRAGAGFAELARARSIRLWAAAKGGELGFGTKASFGILGDRFFGAAAGQLVGPERVDPYWGVFKVLAKREGRAMSFEESRDEVIKAVAFLRKQEVFKEAVDRLRGEASVGIHEDVLANVEIK
jgi:parvulin-like peptidyl-prolyl isomerase